MSQPVRILGISAYYHDAAAALLEDGRIVAAAQEERFTRIKGDSAFPHHAISFCLDTAGIHEEELDYVVFYENPLTKFERLLTTYHLTAPRSFTSFVEAFPSWLTEKVWLENEIAREMGLSKRIYFCDHHLSHASSAFFPSPFEVGRDPHGGRRRRVVHHHLGRGPGQPRRTARADPLPELVGPALLGVHPLHRLQDQQRRVQVDGAGSVWTAALRRSDPRSTAPARRGRLDRAEPGVLRLQRRPAHDERALPRALRGSAARARIQHHAAGNGSRGERPGRAR